MKCIVKKFGILLLSCTLAAGAVSCGEKIPLEGKYDTFITTERFGIGVPKTAAQMSFYGEDLCVGGNENVPAENVTDELSKAAGLFDLENKTIPYAYQIHERMYPASTTKIMTAYVALKYGELSKTATVSEEALQLEEGSSVCGLSVGDKISLEELLYGLMMCSGNDAANVIAEMISGSTEGFVRLMNQEALALGATETHFINPHGLHDEQHYTTVYDLYLIFQAALAENTFRQIISTTSYQATLTNSQGEPVEKSWATTNQYLRGEKEPPEGVTVIGGKTGTTGEAGYCLVLYSEDDKGRPFISIVLKADGRDNLYYHMTELLKEI